MTTVRTLIAPEIPPVAIRSPKPTCANGHPWKRETTRWRYRTRTSRGKHSWEGWERDCLVCKQVAKGREGSGLRTQTWIPGGTK